MPLNLLDPQHLTLSRAYRRINSLKKSFLANGLLPKYFLLGIPIKL